MTLPGRTSSSTAYRYGFQGQEKDDELKGEGNSLNYTFRMHDPRVGRWFARDPSESTYPSYSTYNYVLNNPIYLIDPNGKSPFDWYKNKLGNYVYDKNIKSQKNLDDEGIDGDYLTNPTLHHYVNGQGVNSYQLNADSTVWDNYTTYMDNFGEIEVGNSGVKIINEYTISDKYDDYISELYSYDDYFRSIEGTNLFKSFNTGAKGKLEFNENSVGLYYKLSYNVSGKLNAEKGFNIFDFVIKLKASLFAKLNTESSFEVGSGIKKTDLKVKNSLFIKTPTPLLFTVENEHSILKIKINLHSVLKEVTILIQNLNQNYNIKIQYKAQQKK